MKWYNEKISYGSMFVILVTWAIAGYLLRAWDPLNVQ